MALSSTDQQKLTTEQQAQIRAATDAYNTAQSKGDTEGMKAAHDTAEAVRATSGYSGGVSGGENIAKQLTQAASAAPTAAPAAAPAATPSSATTLSVYDQQNLSPDEQAAVVGFKKAYAEAQATGNTAAMNSARAAVESIRARYNYSGGVDGSEYVPLNKPASKVPSAISGVNTSGMEAQLAQLTEAQKAQSSAAVDYATQQSVIELQRAQEAAKAQFQTGRDQVAADEATALDNQALYAETRGDNGGIGAAQFAAIQNNAAQNRLAVNQQQTKLATDTAQQISDLRAQGEYEKADKVLSITQSYLSQLMSLEQWAMETNLSVEQFNAQLQQWQAEFDLSVQQYKTNTELSTAQLTGQFSNGTSTLDAKNALTSSLASAGNTLLSMGIIPSDSQLAAMSLTKEQAQAYVTAAELAAAAKKSGGGSGGGSKSTSDASLLQQMKEAGIKTDYEAYTWLVSNGYKTADIAETISDGYSDWLATSDGSAGASTDRMWKIASGLKTDWTKAGFNKSQIATRIEQQVSSGVLSEEVATSLYDYFGI